MIAPRTANMTYSDLRLKLLPTPRHGSDNPGQRVKVANINNLAGRVRIAQRPAKGDVSRSILKKGGAVVAAARYTILRSDVISSGQRNEFLHQAGRNNIGIVHGAHHKSLAQKGISKALGFERRIGTNEGVHGEDIIWRATFTSQ